jgi:excisionase family DNA binding protein
VTSIEATLESIVRTVLREELAAALGQAKPSEYLAVRDAATRAGVSSATVRRWVRDGKVTRFGEGRIVRVRWADVEAALAKGEQPTTEADIDATVTRIYGGR